MTGSMGSMKEATGFVYCLVNKLDSECGENVNYGGYNILINIFV